MAGLLRTRRPHFAAAPILGVLILGAAGCTLDRAPTASADTVESEGAPVLRPGPVFTGGARSGTGGTIDSSDEFPLTTVDGAVLPLPPDPIFVPAPDASVPEVDDDAGVTPDAAVEGEPPCSDCAPDAGEPPPPPAPAADGERCSTDDECASGHCNAGLCCAGGACCLTRADCMTDATRTAAVCTDTARCQGERGEVSCEAFSCVATLGLPDDSGCHASIEANDCGYYPTVSCTGDADQSAPTCATSCGSDADCDADALCYEGACVPGLPDGESCGGDSDCESDHCQNGYCCAGGDCCQRDLDCPGSIAVGGTCTDAISCTGSVVVATCSSASQCVQATRDAPAVCFGEVAEDCGRYKPILCGLRGPAQAACPDHCDDDSDCQSPFQCDEGKCEKPKRRKRGGRDDDDDDDDDDD